MAAWFALAATLGNGVFSPLRAQAADLYWDANGAAAGTGGTGTWTAANLWRNGSDVGALQNWADANNAFLQGTAGNITIGSTAVAPLTTFVQVTGYTIQTDSATGRTLGGAINLSSSVNLGILEAAQTAARTINIGSVTGGAGSTLTIQGTQGSGLAARVNLNQASSSIDVPIIINQAGAGVAGIVATNTGVSLTSNATITNNSTGMTILGATSGNSLTVNGAVSGTAGLMFAAGGSGGAGTITLNAANTYQGATAFNAANSGLIKLGINNALSTVSNVTMGFSASNGGILDLNGFNQEIASLTNGAGGGSITNNAAGAGTNTLMISGSTSPAAFTLNITDGATAKTGIERSGTGTLTLGGTVNHNTYSGATTITSGTIKAAAASVFSANSVHSVGASGTLDLGGFSNSVGLLAGSGSVISSAAGSVTLNLDGTSGSQSFGGTVQDGAGAVSLGKSGGSTQIFTSANTYTGTTAISGGTLLANNGSGSATGTGNITVTGGTFGGSGSVTGSVTLNANGILSAGSGLGLAGMLTTGAQTWNSSAGLNFDINDANGSAGNAFDTLSIVGGLNLSALTTSSFNVNLFSRDTSGNPTSSVTNFNNGLDYSWTLATASGGITGFNAANFSIIQTGFTAPLNGGTFTLATSGNNLNLLFTHGSYAPKNLTWTNASADGLWNATSVNWTEPPATAFTNTDNVTFDSSATPGTVTVDAGGVTPGSVVVSNTSGTYTFAGGSIGGSGSLTKSGAGTLVLSPTSSNAYAGGTFANGGTLAIANDNALGNLSGAVTFNGGTLRTDAAITSSRALTVSSGGATIDTNGFDSILTPSSAIALTGSFTKSGAGSLDVRTNGFSGAGTVNVTGGQLTLGDTTSAASNPITFLGNGTNSLNLNGGGLRIAASTTGTLASAGNTIAGTSTVTLFQTATTAAAMTHTIGGTTSVSGTLSIEAAGNVTTGGNSNSRLILGTTSYAGATTFQMAASGAAGNVTASNLTLGATIDNGFQTTFLSQGSATQLPGNGAFLNTASTFTGNWVIGNTTGTGGVIVSLGVPGSQA